MKISKIMEKMISITVKREIALEANFMESSFPEETNFEEKSGTNAEVKAPSAKRLRNRFGSLNETRNASDKVPAPRKLAIIISRIKPVMRLIIVKPPNVAIDFAKDIFFPFNKFRFFEFILNLLIKGK
jgi:hypothetical protein